MATSTGMELFTPTRELPLWINRTKVGRVSETVEVSGVKQTTTVRSEQPVILPLPNGGTYTLPPGGIIVGKYFEKCRGWKSVQPLFIAVLRHQIHDPLNLLSIAAEDGFSPEVGSAPNGETTIYGRTVDGWRLYLRSVRDDQMTQEYGKRKILRRIGEFCGVSVPEDVQFLDGLAVLRKWAHGSK